MAAQCDLDQVTNGLFVRMATLYLMQLAREQA